MVCERVSSKILDQQAYIGVLGIAEAQRFVGIHWILELHDQEIVETIDFNGRNRAGLGLAIHLLCCRDAELSQQLSGDCGWNLQILAEHQGEQGAIRHRLSHHRRRLVRLARQVGHRCCLDAGHAIAAADLKSLISLQNDVSACGLGGQRRGQELRPAFILPTFEANPCDAATE